MSEDDDAHTYRVIISVVWACCSIPAAMVAFILAVLGAIGEPTSCSHVSLVAAIFAIMLAAAVVCPISAILVWFVPDPPSIAFTCSALLPVFVWGGAIVVPGLLGSYSTLCIDRCRCWKVSKKGRDADEGDQSAAAAAVIGPKYRHHGPPLPLTLTIYHAAVAAGTSTSTTPAAVSCLLGAGDVHADSAATSAPLPPSPP
ncbi:hypothetical protein HK405_008763 [Cladochytrium tenue]|nr:hypothetical protein HK405_008763 [Cladochytrium tenue]